MVELCVYDKEINLIGVIDEIISLIWIRRYWNAGEFKLLIPYAEQYIDILEEGNLVMPFGATRAGQIRYMHIEKDAFGMENIEVQGYLLSGWLGKRLVIPMITATANTYNLMNRIVSENLINPAVVDRRIDKLDIMANPDLASESTIDYASEPYISALIANETLAKAAGLGFEIITDVRTKRHSFKVYKGRDLSSDQAANPPCIFSQAFDNVLEQSYTAGVENVRTAAYVVGKDGTPVVPVGGGEGLLRDELFVDASNIEPTEPNYMALLQQRGVEELARHTETLSFNSRINTAGHLKYMEDFDVGDIVTCIDKRWGVKINVRITEVMEIFQKEGTEIDVTFGEALPTLMEKLRR